MRLENRHGSRSRPIGSTVLLSIILFLIAGGTRAVPAHPPEEDGPGPNGQAMHHEPPSEAIGRALLLPESTGPMPWSDAPVLNAPDRFHIAIMTDRTGGHRPGVWMKGVRAVNLLRPDFVVSIGDLIEGYTEDRQQVETEWREFLDFIKQLEMKFFFVAGNHDLTNPMMHEVWRKHFGREWYSFDYRGVHFVCLNSEDPVTHLGADQLAWLKDDLSQHIDARWTLLFVHKPLWSYAQRERAAGNPDSTGWTQVESMLGSRPHTVFAGHVHHYVQFDRNGNKYYHLATTGGASQLRGTSYGEFDHVMWLTMEEDGPHVANLLLDGVLPGDVVTQQGIARFRTFLAKTVVEVAPIWVEDREGFSHGQIHVRLTNRFDRPVELSGKILGLPLRGLLLDPESVHLSAQPGESVPLALEVQFTKDIPLHHLAQTLLTARIKTVGEEPTLAAEWTVPITIDRKYSLPQRTTEVTINGLLDDWRAMRFRTGDSPLVLGAVNAWQGSGDASADFDLDYDLDHVHFAANIQDDALAGGDAVELHLDARPLAQRAKDSLLRRNAYTFRIDPIEKRPTKNGEDSPLTITPHHGSPPAPPGCHAVSKQTAKGYSIELAIPAKLLRRAQGTDWQSIQATVVVHDVDEQGADEQGQGAARVVWRGTTDVHQRNTGYGQFVREEVVAE